MKTRFYKILYNNQDVVYVGVTTRTIQKRFQQHIRDKKLNTTFYSVTEFDSIEHPTIRSLADFYRERKKVSILEQKYIQQHKNMGCKLLNISDGGEWGCSLYNKIRKNDFFERYGTYDGYEVFKKHADKIKTWLRSWIQHTTSSKSKTWLRTWVNHRSENKSKTWLRNWVTHKINNKSKIWLRKWLLNKTKPKLKRWIYNWVVCRSKMKTYSWLINWVYYRSRNRLNKWLRSWICIKSKLKIKVWLRDWVKVRTEKKTKVWLRSWVRVRCK